MNNLYIISDIINYGYFIATLDVFTSFSVISAVIIITIKNPIVSVLFLIILFFGVSSYLICSGATFIGLAYLLVYVGAVSILFLFILMLINIRVSELVTETKNSIPLVLIVALIFRYADNILLFFNASQHNNLLWYAHEPIIVSHNNWEDVSRVSDHITSVGNVMYSVFGILLLIVSIILLLAMVGAIAITIRPSSSVQILRGHTLQSNLWKKIRF